MLVAEHTAPREPTAIIKKIDRAGEYADQRALACIHVAHDSNAQVQVVPLRRQLAHHTIHGAQQHIFLHLFATMHNGAVARDGFSYLP
eukprot:scaffold75663_cov31-Tisochrysis_lutea.AAC.7